MAAFIGSSTLMSEDPIFNLYLKDSPAEITLSLFNSKVKSSCEFVSNPHNEQMVEKSE